MPRFLIERNFAEQLELYRDSFTAAHAGQCGRGCAVAALLPQRRQEEDLLPVRGAQRRGDPRGGAAAEHPGGCDHRGG